VYMQQRYYDPVVGRFLSVDPVTADSVTGSNFNRYWYANNNPYRFTDPDGRQSVDDYGTKREDCGSCTLVRMGPKGERAFVPTAIAADVISARDSGARSLADYNNVTKQDVVDTADSVGNISGAAAVGLSRVPAPQAQAAAGVLGAVSVVAKGTALALDPSEDRAASAAADVLLKGAGKLTKGTETAAEGMVDGIENARATMDVVKEANKLKHDE